MKKFKLLLLDANIVIKTFELGLWQKLAERCEIWLAATVIQEAAFFTTEDGNPPSIDLRPDVERNRAARFCFAIASFIICSKHEHY
jgi:hypothetical protein